MNQSFLRENRRGGIFHDIREMEGDWVSQVLSALWGCYEKTLVVSSEAVEAGLLFWTERKKASRVRIIFKRYEVNCFLGFCAEIGEGALDDTLDASVDAVLLKPARLWARFFKIPMDQNKMLIVPGWKARIRHQCRTGFKCLRFGLENCWRTDFSLLKKIWGRLLWVEEVLFLVKMRKTRRVAWQSASFWSTSWTTALTNVEKSPGCRPDLCIIDKKVDDTVDKMREARKKLTGVIWLTILTALRDLWMSHRKIFGVDSVTCGIPQPLQWSTFCRF